MMEDIPGISDEKTFLSNKTLYNNKIGQRSEMAQEIISHEPDFMEKWAFLIFLLVLLFLLLGTWFIEYPDVIQANATLTAINAPKEIVTRQDGKLEKLFVVNDETVVQGQMIAWMESTASHKEVIALSKLLDSGITFLSNNRTEMVSTLFKTGLQGLGEIQPSYQQFIVALQQFNDYLVNGYYYKRKEGLFEDQGFLRKMQQSLQQQEALTQQDIQLTQDALDANNSLYKEKVISQQDLRDQKSKLVAKEMSMPQLESSSLTNKNLQTGKQKEIDELEHTISQQKSIFQQALQTLKSLTDDWRKKYIISAPVDGKVVFIVPLQQNQFLQLGKTIGFVNPPDSRYYAQVTLPQNNFGKIYIGQTVQLRLDAYPYQEFGSIEGRLSYISKVPSDSGFLANIELPKGLVTSYRKGIQYRSGLKSQALIITHNARLLKRFYYSIVKTVQDKG